MDIQKLIWAKEEYEERERSPDWFWALGVIVATSSIASMIFGNYFFATLLIISGVLLWHFANRPPSMIDYELNSKGLKIGTRFYPYQNIKSFWVQIPHPDHPEQVDLAPTLFIKSERFFIPVISMPIDYEDAENIHFILTSKDVTEEEMKEHPSEKIMDVLGF